MKDTTLVFLGDSVTDCSRKRAARYEGSQDALGSGWVKKVAGTLVEQDKANVVFNRGYSGCRIDELMSEEDWWPVSHAVDLVSLMIGINDIWHPIRNGESHTIEQVLHDFDALVAELNYRAEKLIVCEPLALPVDEVTDQWWAPLQQLCDGQKAICEKRNVPWLSLKDDLKKDSEGHFGDYLADGVHPTDLGHEWIAKKWLSFVEDNHLL